MQHQDWTPVILRKRKQNNVLQSHVQKQISQFQPQYKNQLNDNTEEFKNKFFDKTYIDTVIAKRVEKKWNQKQLATSINVDVHVIQRFEQGKEVYDHILKSKLNKVLGIRSAL
jgi:ribosome-binding protein aMBF1 (putative translation factor)